MRLRFNTQDGHAGLMFIAVGLFFSVKTLIDLPLGTLDQMGPGYFPLALGIILTALGVAVFLKAQPDEVKMQAINWRAMALITAAPIVFGLTVRSLGLVPALLSSITLAVLASPRIGFAKGVVVVLGMTLFCVAVFKFGVGVPYHLINPKYWY